MVQWGALKGKSKQERAKMVGDETARKEAKEAEFRSALEAHRGELLAGVAAADERGDSFEFSAGEFVKGDGKEWDIEKDISFLIGHFKNETPRQWRVWHIAKNAEDETVGFIVATVEVWARQQLAHNNDIRMAQTEDESDALFGKKCKALISAAAEIRATGKRVEYNGGQSKTPWYETKELVLKISPAKEQAKAA